MSISFAGIRIAQRAIRKAEIPIADLPAFLCPGILSIRPQPTKSFSVNQPRLFQLASQQRLINTTPSSDTGSALLPPSLPLERLPQQCPGCGAFSQFIDVEEPGFYTLKRKNVKEYLGVDSPPALSAEDAIVKVALKNARKAAANLNLGGSARPSKPVEPPICDRCHELKHHSTGVSIRHPSVMSIQDTIFESPHKYNHIYHVIDAADFPMSLVPGLHKLLHLTPQRSLNRRSKTGKFYHGRKTEMSFIITRSDLLAPLKEQVDSMMPYLRATLRDTLGRSGKDVRLGNVRCVSAKRQWWTKELKEEIYKRGGGGWMVGKVNVGKSQLFHDVFPKGRRDPKTKLISSNTSLKEIVASAGSQNAVQVSQEREGPKSIEYKAGVPIVEPLGTAALGETGAEVAETAVTEAAEAEDTSQSIVRGSHDTSIEHTQPKTATAIIQEPASNDFVATSTLLPPASPETDYPIMPLVSSLPGTTASPIRLSFGSGKGELIDLPGLSRGDLELHVKPEHRSSLVMRSRISPEQQPIKPGQSLLLGGFIRITPTMSDVIILAYAFTPLTAHRTATLKAMDIQAQTWEGNVENIALPEAAAKTTSAGIFRLKWDVTREHTGPITDPSAVGLKVDKLPYRVLSTDILIEGCGWIELAAQVRKRSSNVLVYQLQEEQNPQNWDSEKVKQAEEVQQKEQREKEEIDPKWPAVEVFTPEGKFVGARRPMNAWSLIANKPKKGFLRGRPRKAMKGVKKEEKKLRRLPKPL